MLIKTKNKNHIFIKIEDFLGYKPRRNDYKWVVDENGIVHITVPKFSGKYGRILCKILRKDECFTVNLDRIGSTVWLNCDGEKTVKDILEVLKNVYPDQENLDQRLYLFLQEMRTLNYVTY